MALRIDALSANRPVRDTRLTSLRELYPQFELYQARFEQATSCDDRMKDFFTLKGLALSLLTLSITTTLNKLGTIFCRRGKGRGSMSSEPPRYRTLASSPTPAAR